MQGESGVTRSIIDKLHSSDIQGDQMEGESGVTGSMIDETQSCDIQWKVKVILLEVTLLNFFLLISKEIKW